MILLSSSQKTGSVEVCISSEWTCLYILFETFRELIAYCMIFEAMFDLVPGQFLISKNTQTTTQGSAIP